MRRGSAGLQESWNGSEFEGVRTLFDFTPGLAGVNGTNEQHFNSLLREYRRFEGNLIPCLGAGMSAPLYPTWARSLSDMTALIPHITGASRVKILGAIARGDFDTAAMDLFEAAGRAAFDDALREVFHVRRIDPGSIATMPVSLLPRIFTRGPVLTLNFDAILESSVYTGTDSFGDRIIRGPAHFTQDRQDLIRGATRTLLKMHGCATRPREVVFTRQQYDQYYGTNNDSTNSAFLSLLFQSHPVLFLGCSLLSDRMMDLLKIVSQGNDLPHFALLPSPESEDEFARAGRALANVGIRPIWYPSGEHHYVRVLLQALERLRPPGNTGTEDVLDPAGLDGSANESHPPPIDKWYVGRADDIREVFARLSSPHLEQAVEVQGGPGIGKSTVCRAVLTKARDLGWSTVDVSLSQVYDKSAAQAAILKAVCGELGIVPATDASHEGLIEDVVATNANSKTILYLDNMEDPQEDPDYVPWLLRTIGSTRWRVLYSTQLAILHPSIFRYQLGPLSQPSAELLFRARWGDEIPDDDAKALSDLVDEAGCHPLSLVLIAGQRDRWRTVPEVLQAWREEARNFQMSDAEPRHRSIAVAYGLAADRVARDQGCLELLAALATVPDHLPSAVMDLVLTSYPPLRTNESDPLTSLLRHGLVDSSIRRVGGVARTVYSVLNPLKAHVRETVDEATVRRAAQRMSKVYGTVFEASRRSIASGRGDPDGLAAALAIQAATLITSSTALDEGSAARLLHAMRDEIQHLPTGLRLILAQYRSGTMAITGGTRLSGRLKVLASGRALVPLLLAAASRSGTSRIRSGQRTAEVDELCRLLEAVGVSVDWSSDGSEVVLHRPQALERSRLAEPDVVTNSWAGCLPFLFLDGPEHMSFPIELHHANDAVPYRYAYRLLEHLTGRSIIVDESGVTLSVRRDSPPVSMRTVLTSPHPLVACLMLIGASQMADGCVLVHVPQSYEVGELCAFLRASGLQIEGFGSSTLAVFRGDELGEDLLYDASPDPVDAMCLISAAIVTGSRVQIERVPVEYMSVELELLREMGVRLDGAWEYPAPNGISRLVDLEVGAVSEELLTARQDALLPDPHGGLSVESLPFFLLVACHSSGRTLIHDWIHRNGWMEISLTRLILGLILLGGPVEVLDSFRLLVSGPARWLARRVEAPEADGPAMCLVVACLAINGEVEINHVEDRWGTISGLAMRLNAIGARIRMT